MLTIILAFLTSRPTPGQAPPAVVSVRVTNTPLPVKGAVNANVTNTPLPVQGTVTANINSLPNVNATITNASLSSLITNPANNPVLVSNVNDSVDREFSGFLCEADFSNPIVCSGASYDPMHQEYISFFTAPTTTPSGLKVTQAVIEYVDGLCRADATDDIVDSCKRSALPMSTR